MACLHRVQRRFHVLMMTHDKTTIFRRKGAVYIEPHYAAVHIMGEDGNPGQRVVGKTCRSAHCACDENHRSGTKFAHNPGIHMMSLHR